MTEKSKITNCVGAYFGAKLKFKQERAEIIYQTQ